MGKGRRPVPDSLKMIRGTFRKDRVNKNAPNPVHVCPKPSKSLNDKERKVWNELAPILYDVGVLTEMDVVALTLLCRDIAMYQVCIATIKKEGRIIEMVGSKGQTIRKVNPCYTIQRQLADSILQMLREFGMTPASRVKIVVDKKPKEKSKLEELRERRRLRKTGGRSPQGPKPTMGRL